MFSIQVRLYLNKEQEFNMRNLLGSCRFVYNQILAYKINAYKIDKTNISYGDMSSYFHNVLRTNKEYSWLLQHNTHIIKQSIRNLDNAYSNFFKHKKRFPNFKKKSNKESCKFPKEAISKYFLTNNKLNLTKTLKNLKFKCSDKYINILNNITRDDIVNITITKSCSGNYHASICLKIDKPNKLLQNTDKCVGVDLGITDDNIKTVNKPKKKKKIKNKSNKHSTVSG